MNYAFSLPTGWYITIGDELNTRLDDLVKRGGKVEQVKEKFGGLRVYVDRGGDEDNLDFNVDDLDKVCQNTCMECGMSGTMTTKRGWIGPRCEDHSGS